MGGRQGVSWHWAVELGGLGHEVHALTNSKYQAAIEAAVASGRVPRGLTFELFMPGWLVHARRVGLRLGFASLTEHLVHLVWQVLAFRFARTRFRAGQFDCVHHLTYGGIRIRR